MFSQQERGRAVELYFSTDMTTQQVVDHLGYPTRQCLERWLHEDPRYSDAVVKPIVPLRKRVRAVRLCLAGMQQKRAAVQLGVSAGAVHHWMALYREGGMAALQPRRRIAVAKEEKPTIRPVPDDIGGLRRRVAELELENALMREVVEVVKKDPGASLGRLSNPEKTRLIDRLRPMFSLSCLARRLAIPLSSYHYHHARGGRDKYSDIQMRVRTLFRDSSSRYGYRRIRHALRERISEKVVRRIMRQEGLVAHVPHRRRYSSYQGESTPAPENLIHRDFRAEGPNMKWLTDITEIKARDGKVYVSPMIDCYDGKIVAYTTGLHPNARLANTMLFVFTWMWTVSSLFLDSRGVHFGRCGRLRNRASMPSGFLIDSRVPVTVFEVPGRKGIDDIDACATAYRAVGGTGHEPRADRARAACVPNDGGGVTPRGRISPLVRPAGLAGR